MRAITLSEEDRKSIPNKMTTTIVYDIAEIYINRLEQENKQLKEDKKKAIEWVKKNQYYFPRPTELLEILEGKDDRE